MCDGQIYSLTDPRNGNVRYIGQTVRTVKQRLVEHVYQAKKNNYKTSTWIKSLLALNMNPMINSLVIVPIENLDICEEGYISHYKQFCKLTNHKPGGASRRGYKMSEETKKKIRDSGAYEKMRIRMLSDANPSSKKLNERKKISFKKISDRMKLQNPATKYSKPIIQYTLTGEFIKEWKSAKEIAKNLNIDTKGIRNCCHGHKFYNQSHGFVWKYKQLNTEKNGL